MLISISIFSTTLASAIGAFLLGALWYSPFLFGNLWIKESGITAQKMASNKHKGLKKLYLLNFISTTLTAYVVTYLVFNLAFFSLADALALATFIWFGLVASTSFGSVIWEGKSVKFFAINAGYHLMAMLLMATMAFYLF